MVDPTPNLDLARRAFLARAGVAAGPLALAWLLGRESAAAETSAPLVPRGQPHFASKAKRVVMLTMNGGPSQLDLFDPKPVLKRRSGEPAPKSLLAGERFAQLNGNKNLLGSPYQFAKHGQNGMNFSELLPHLAGMADQLTMVRSLTTDSVNHDPAMTQLNTGAITSGRPGFGSWVVYGLGSACDDLPAYVVCHSGKGQSIGAHNWSSGFLPTIYQGVQFRGQGDPVLYLRDPEWMKRESRRRSLDALRKLNESERAASGDPEIDTRIASYEMAFRMQSSVPSLTDLKQESAATLARYGADPEQPSFARNCLLARRMLERGVRFVQLYHRDWDHHGDIGAGGIAKELPIVCREVDRPTAALISDLKERGLLDDTLVVWGGEFGRTPMQQSDAETVSLGRDHHRRAFTMLLAGGGLKPGYTFGATDELGFHAVENKVHVHDLQATLLHLLGFDHERLTYRFQGRDYRLTDVDGSVIKEIVA